MKKRKTAWVKVYAKADCGCCEFEMKFDSKESAEKAFKKAGLTSSAKITDDKGIAHDGIDTFYGFALEESEAAKRSLGYLFDQL